MTSKKLDNLYIIATEAHARIQKDFTELNPVIGVSQKMREVGVPSDVMTIDCKKSGKRIILILNDNEPETITFQYTFIDKDPDKKFQQIKFTELTSEELYQWIKGYFLEPKH